MTARPIAACLAISAAVTGFVFGVGAFGAFALAVALNGFTETQAMPWFIAWIALVCAVNVVLLLRANGRVLESAQGLDPRRRSALKAAFAAAYTAVPFVLFAGYLAWANLRAAR